MKQKFSNPLYWLIAVAIIGMVVPMMHSLAKTGIANTGKQTTGTVRLIHDYDSTSPIVIDKITVEGKEVKDGENFLAAVDWAKTVQIVIRNKSADKTLMQASFAVDFDNPSPTRLNLGAGGEDSKAIALKPGESVTAGFDLSVLQYFNDIYKDKGVYPTSLSLMPEAAIYLGGEKAWMYGEEHFKYKSGDRVLWISESADWSDPELQKILDPNRKVSLGMPNKMRFDESSNQYLLDANGADCLRPRPLAWLSCGGECPTCYFQAISGFSGCGSANNDCKWIVSKDVTCRTSQSLQAPLCGAGCSVYVPVITTPCQSN